MAAVRGILFDYGDTLGDLRVAEQEILAVYGDVRNRLAAEARQDLPTAPDLVQNVTVRIIRLVSESYRRHQLEELDALTLFEDAFRSLGLNVPRDLVQEIAELEYRAMVTDRTVSPENLEVLQQLRQRGLRLGLVSNAHFLPALMLEDFERLGLSELFDAIVISSQVGVRKPHPEIFRRALAELELTPEETVFVGDKMREDVLGPKELGMRAVLTRQFRREEFDGAQQAPDYVIDSLHELVPYVDALRARTTPDSA